MFSMSQLDQKIKKLDIRVGDYVFIEKGGDIIPKITKVNQSLRPNIALNKHLFMFPTRPFFKYI